MEVAIGTINAGGMEASRGMEASKSTIVRSLHIPSLATLPSVSSFLKWKKKKKKGDNHNMYLTELLGRLGKLIYTKSLSMAFYAWKGLNICSCCHCHQHHHHHLGHSCEWCNGAGPCGVLLCAKYSAKNYTPGVGRAMLYAMCLALLYVSSLISLNPPDSL